MQKQNKIVEVNSSSIGDKDKACAELASRTVTRQMTELKGIFSSSGLI